MLAHGQCAVMHVLMGDELYCTFIHVCTCMKRHLYNTYMYIPVASQSSSHMHVLMGDVSSSGKDALLLTIVTTTQVSHTYWEWAM